MNPTEDNYLWSSTPDSLEIFGVTNNTNNRMIDAFRSAVQRMPTMMPDIIWALGEASASDIVSAVERRDGLLPDPPTEHIHGVSVKVADTIFCVSCCDAGAVRLAQYIRETNVRDRYFVFTSARYWSLYSPFETFSASHFLLYRWDPAPIDQPRPRTDSGASLLPVINSDLVDGNFLRVFNDFNRELNGILPPKEVAESFVRSAILRQEMYEVRVGLQSVGILFYEMSTDVGSQVSVFIKPEWRGLGYANDALEAAELNANYYGISLWACIGPSNGPSLRMVQQLNFREIDEIGLIEVHR